MEISNQYLFLINNIINFLAKIQVKSIILTLNEKFLICVKFDHKKRPNK